MIESWQDRLRKWVCRAIGHREAKSQECVSCKRCRRLLRGLPMTSNSTPTEREAGDVGCTCANDGNASRCPLHTQADYDASARAGDVGEVAARVRALADEWEALAGEESAAWRVYGPQTISVPFAVRALRAALDGEA